MRRFLLLALLLIASAASAQVSPCRLPGCLAPDQSPPGGLKVAETPQIIVVTFDDAIQDRLETRSINPWWGSVVNPGGREAHRTYFAQALYTQPTVARKLYLAGHEIANHTHDHNTSTATTEAEWTRQIDGLTRFMRDTVGVNPSDIVGFRTPFLATNQALWKVLQQKKVLYDATLTEESGSPFSKDLAHFVWPHTLNTGAGTACTSSACPQTPIPGMWAVPLWVTYNTDGRSLSTMDPEGRFVDDSTGFYNALMYTFEKRYSGNRAPLGLYFHAGRLDYPAQHAGLRRFFNTVMARGDVWVLTVRGLVSWMQQPVPNSGMAAWYDHGGETGKTVTGVDAGQADARATLRAFPNPATDRVTVRGLRAATETVRLFDALGRLQRTEIVPPGGTEVQILLDGLSSGVYVIEAGASRTLLVRR